MTLREFLRLNLSGRQRTAIQTQQPVLLAALEDRSLDDRGFVLRVIQGNDAALWLLWFCLHSSFFVRVIRMRSKQECGQPCSLVDFERLPCRWSARVLGDYYHTLTRPGSGLEAYCVDDPDLPGIMDWLAIRLHETFHVEMLEANGFAAPSESELPPALQKLFHRDARFRAIFLNRWLWGLVDIEELANAVRPPLPNETLLAWVDLVDDALLSAPEGATLHRRLEALHGRRVRSGIPPRGHAPRSP